MKNKNTFWILAGVINLLTFLLHLTGGQIELVTPMIDSTLPIEKSSQLVGAWHMVSIILLVTSYILLMAGFNKKFYKNIELIKLTCYLNLSFCLPFLLTGFYYGILIPQWILFLPIGILTLTGIKKAQ